MHNPSDRGWHGTGVFPPPGRPLDTMRFLSKKTISIENCTVFTRLFLGYRTVTLEHGHRGTVIPCYGLPENVYV